MSDPLSRAAIEVADPGGMLGEVLAQPHQLGDALWRAESAGIPERDLPSGLVVCGMGGSAIGGDLAVAALGDRATRPIVTVREYGLESWRSPDSLVLCASYSGNTEETLACFDAAGAAGTERVALTTGGKLAEMARAEDVPVIGAPAGMQPRAAVLYMTVGALECAALCGAAPRLRSETAAVARRWRTQINENAKAAAFWSELPEADHNEICAWERGREAAPLVGLFLVDPDQHPRVHRRIELTAASVERAGAPAITFEARGRTRLERVLSLILLGDLVSVYLAVLEGVDPTPVEPIERLKAALD
jgi:glucose/mannose-6-phosphate isomerase